jgi:hypothetical protein
MWSLFQTNVYLVEFNINMAVWFIVDFGVNFSFINLCSLLSDGLMHSTWKFRITIMCSFMVISAPIITNSTSFKLRFYQCLKNNICVQFLQDVLRVPTIFLNIYKQHQRNGILPKSLDLNVKLYGVKLTASKEVLVQCHKPSTTFIRKLSNSE